MTIKRFPLRVVLTVSTGRLLTKPTDFGNGIKDVYDILNWMTRDDLYTHQIPRAMGECRPWLLRWFPELSKVDALDMECLDRMRKETGDVDGCEAWLVDVARNRDLATHYAVPRIPQDDHDRIDPYDELVQMRGTDEGIIIV